MLHIFIYSAANSYTCKVCHVELSFTQGYAHEQLATSCSRILCYIHICIQLRSPKLQSTQIPVSCYGNTLVVMMSQDAPLLIFFTLRIPCSIHFHGLLLTPPAIPVDGCHGYSLVLTIETRRGCSVGNLFPACMTIVRCLMGGVQCTTK